MADRTPSLLPLSDANRFEASVYESHARSPSSSPTRYGRLVSHELDPLLANLSPISTLGALRANATIPSLPGSKDRLLADSIAEASESERALGIRAALAGKKLREWVEEVQDWHWPSGKFAPPLGKEKFQDAGNQGSKGAIVQSEPTATPTDSRELYWGSLPAKSVQERENRIENIRDDMDTLELSELKSYVQITHSTSSSRSTSYDTGFNSLPSSQYNHMDDFTVVITATIIQALPFLARLESLLSRWSLRLFVLRQVPRFLQQLEDTQLALESAWTTLRHAVEDSSAFEMTREAYVAIKLVLQSRVSELARRIDGILDMLEGQNDRIPDRWIDKMEDAETDFQNWIAEAERMVELNEWLTRRKSIAMEDSTTEPDQAGPSEGKSLLSRATQGGVRRESGAESIGLPLAQDTKVGQSIGQSTELQASTQVPESPTIAAIENKNQLEGKRTPSRRLFFMRDTSPSATGPGSAPPKDYNDSSKQSQVPLFGLAVREGGQQKDRFNDYETHADRNMRTEEENSPTVRRASQRKPPPLALDHGEVEPAPNSQLSRTTSESSASDAFSDMSSPQIIDASSVQFFKTPMEEKFPSWVTQDDSTPVRNQSQKTAQGFSGHARSVSAMDPMTRSRASSHVSDITIMGRETKDDQKSQGDIQTGLRGAGAEFRRASIAAIEEVPRSELRNVSIPETSDQGAKSLGGSYFDIGEQMAASQRELEAEQGEDFATQGDASPSLRVKKTRALPPADISNLSEPATHAAESSDSGASSVQKVPEDKLSAKITSILSRIPAPIRLASTPIQKTVETNITQKQTPPSRPQRSISSAPITLVPASTRTPQQSEMEGKLYHLIQPGKDVPIKLFIRLVGTEDRVMVRVGGGWADLAEYLKEYAMHHQHHGRRAVSENKFEINHLPSQGTPVFPSTNPMENTRSPAGSVPGNTPNNRPQTPGIQQSGELSQYEPLNEPSELTPASNTSEPSSTGPPSAASSLGLAGPKSRKVEISPQKKAWVDGMLNQARHISFEHKKPETNEVGDSSKGIKRVFMKAKGDE